MKYPTHTTIRYVGTYLGAMRAWWGLKRCEPIKGEAPDRLGVAQNYCIAM